MNIRDSEQSWAPQRGQKKEAPRTMCHMWTPVFRVTVSVLIASSGGRHAISLWLHTPGNLMPSLMEMVLHFLLLISEAQTQFMGLCNNRHLATLPPFTPPFPQVPTQIKLLPAIHSHNQNHVYKKRNTK